MVTEQNVYGHFLQWNSQLRLWLLVAMLEMNERHYRSEIPMQVSAMRMQTYTKDVRGEERGENREREEKERGREREEKEREKERGGKGMKDKEKRGMEGRKGTRVL